MHALLKQKQSLMTGEAIEFAQHLVRTPSTSGKESDVAEMVLAAMKDLGFDEAFMDADGNVVGILVGREHGPTLLLNSHLDTVEPLNPEGWTRPPYDGVIEDGRLYGLGACDCKGGLAMQIYAAALLKRSLLPLRGNLVVAATVCEENGASTGLKTLMDETLREIEMTPDFAILGEPTSLRLNYGHSGRMELEVRIEGADTSTVRDTAMDLYGELSRRTSKTDIDGVQSLVVEPPEVTCSDNVARGVVAVAQRVGSIGAESMTMESMRHEARLVAQQHGAVTVDVEIMETPRRLAKGRIVQTKRLTHAWEIDPFHPLLERSRRALSAAGLGAASGRWRLGLLGTGTAGGALVCQFSTPPIGYGPGDEAVAHQCDEYVDVDRIHDGIYGTAAIAHAVVGVPVLGWTSDEI
jgi:acetylornithine deacetylase/succinyl-diaminopimelate desuccinylase-like protein